MVSKDKIIKLTNRDVGSVGYSVPDLRVHRQFSSGETKEVTFDEIEKLSFTRGGKVLLKDYLIIEDPEAAEEIFGEVEPEYFYTQETVKKLLKEGTVEQLQDTLEFGPKGVVELVKHEAVKEKIDSNIKRELIQEATGFNVSRSIELSSADPEDEKQTSEAATSKRRANPIAATSTKTTTSSGSKYKIIS